MAFSEGAGVGQQRNALSGGKGIMKSAPGAHPILKIKGGVHKNGATGFAVFSKYLVFVR